VNRPVFHSARPQISTSICSDSLQPYYRWGADCGNMAKPCSQRSELVTMVAHHPSRIVAWSKIRQCKNAEIHATTCVMSFQAFTILVFVVQYLIFFKGGLLFRKKWLSLRIGCCMQCTHRVEVARRGKVQCCFQRVFCAPYLFCLLY
jgi:hypothetical protein